MEKRLNANIECIQLLTDYVLDHPKLRIEQILYGFDQNKDYFYEEPDETIKRWSYYINKKHE